MITCWFIRLIKKHWKHVKLILKILLTHRLYAKLFKCAFNRNEIIFLNFIINKNDIKMKQSRIDAIFEWFISKYTKNILMFLNFAKFYRKFVRNFSQIITFFIDLTKKTKKLLKSNLFDSSKHKKHLINSNVFLQIRLFLYISIENLKFA